MTDGAIKIEYAAVLNAREGYGWIPLLWVNGHQRGATYRNNGGDQDWAHDEAERLAHDEAGRYCGDWDITLSPRL